MRNNKNVGSALFKIHLVHICQKYLPILHNQSWANKEKQVVFIDPVCALG